jgi:hypothetical protein
MDIDYFFEAFLDHSPEIECHHGLKLVWTGEFANRYWGAVPVFRVENPEDSPYTFEALSAEMEVALYDFKKMIPLQRSIKLDLLYEFDQTQPDMYIPTRVSKKIRNCLRETKVDKSRDPIRLIGGFDGDFEFSSSVDSEMINVNIDFLMDKMLLDGEEIDGSHKDYDDWVDYFRYDNRDFLEDEIWSCFDELSTNKNFYNYEWMGWYTNFYIIT